MASPAVELERLMVRLVADATEYTPIIEQAEADVVQATQTIERAAKIAMAAQNDALQEAARITAAVATPMERYSLQVEGLQTHLAAARITQETYNRALNEAAAELPETRRVQEAYAAEMRLAESITRGVASAEENYAARVRELQGLLSKGRITQETYNRAVNELRTTLPAVQRQVAALRAEEQRHVATLRQVEQTFDRFLTPAQRHQRELREIERLYRTGMVSAQSYRQAVRGIAKEYDTMGPSLRRAEQMMRSVGQTMSLFVTAPILAAGAGSLKEFADFDSQLRQIQASANPTAEEMERVKQAAMDLSAELRVVTPETVAQGFTELLKAGQSVEAVLGGAGKSAVQFAKVGELEVSAAAIVMTDGMNLFKESAEDTVNTMSAAADVSSVSIRQITESFSQSASVARLANQTLEDTAATIALFGKNAMKGSDAGTSFRTFLIRLMAPTDDAREAMEQLNFQARDAEGSIRPMGDLIDELTSKLGSLNEEAQQEVLQKIFGQDAIRAGAILLQTGRKGFEDLKASMQDSLSVSEKYATITGGLQGTWDEFTASLSRLAITIGEALSNQLSGLLEWITEFMNEAQEWISNNEEIATTLFAIAGAAAALGPLILTLATATAAIRALHEASLISVTSMGLLKTAMAGLALAGIYVVSRALYDANVRMREFNHEMERAQGLNTEVIDRMIRQQTEVMKEAQSLEGDEKKTFLAEQLEMTRKNLEGVQDQVKAAKEEVAKYDTTWKNAIGHKVLEVARKDLKDAEQRARLTTSAVKDLETAILDLEREGKKDLKAALPGSETVGAASKGSQFDAAKEAKKEMEKLLKDSMTAQQKFDAIQEKATLAMRDNALTHKEYFAIMRDAAAEFERDDPARKIINDLETQIKTFGMTKEQVDAYKLSLTDASDADKQQAKTLADKLKALEDEKDANKEAQKIMEKYASPAEKLGKIQEKLTKYFNEGKISAEAFRYEMAEAQKDFKKETKVKFKVEGLDAVEAETAQFEAMLADIRRGAAKDLPVVPLPEKVGGDGAALIAAGKIPQGVQGQPKVEGVDKDVVGKTQQDEMLIVLREIRDKLPEKRAGAEKKIVIEPSSLVAR